MNFAEKVQDYLERVVRPATEAMTNKMLEVLLGGIGEDIPKSDMNEWGDHLSDETLNYTKEKVLSNLIEEEFEILWQVSRDPLFEDVMKKTLKVTSEIDIKESEEFARRALQKCSDSNGFKKLLLRE